MNKAFVREPEPDSRGYCPRCGSLGTAVGEVTLDRQIQSKPRTRLGDSAWFCGFSKCDVAYFDSLERCVAVDELETTVYPKDPAAPICACFGFTLDDIEDDVREGTPVRIRELLAKSATDAAECRLRAADGRCCMREVQRIYMKWISPTNG